MKTLFILNGPPYGSSTDELTDWTVRAEEAIVFQETSLQPPSSILHPI